MMKESITSETHTNEPKIFETGVRNLEKNNSASDKIENVGSEEGADNIHDYIDANASKTENFGKSFHHLKK